jgi:hypothetical protein
MPPSHQLSSSLFAAALLLLAGSPGARADACTDRWGPFIDPGSDGCKDKGSYSNDFCSATAFGWGWTWCTQTTYCKYTNQWQCDKCNAGYYRWGASRGATTLAGIAGWASMTNTHKAKMQLCYHCPAGSACPEDSTSKTTCAKHHWSAANSASCTRCSAGYYASGTGNTGCAECAKGKWGQHSGSDNLCHNCGAGKYTDQNHQTTCKNW